MQDLGSSIRDWTHTRCTGVMASQPLGSQGSTPKFLRDSTLYVLFSFCLILCHFYSSTFKFIDSLLSWVPINGIHLPPALLAFALDSFFYVASLACDSLCGFACCLPYPLDPVFIIQLFPMSVSCLTLVPMTVLSLRRFFPLLFVCFIICWELNILYQTAGTGHGFPSTISESI